jgi:hypothetical protein
MPLKKIGSTRAPWLSAATQVARLANTPAPVGGLNLRDPISMMAPQDALVLTNFIPRQQGVELRAGWRFHTSSAMPAEVKSIFGYQAANSTNNKLFAAAGGKIYDITSGTPTVAVATTGSTDDVWQTTQFSTTADTFLLAVSPGAGYWTYSAATGWVDRTALTVGLPTSVQSVSVWKRRVWFSCKDDPQAYYMRAVDSIQGHADPFPMGSTLRSGGHIVALINWTLDAGIGIDDHLVAIGSQGDVAVWKGTDPSSTSTFALHGIWYIGPVPTKGRFYTPMGGDVMVLSEMGVVPLSQLTRGEFSEEQAIQAGPSAKIESVLSPLIKTLRTTASWDFFSVPWESILIIKLPAQTGVFEQYVMNTVTMSWCKFSGFDMNCATVFGGALYYGMTSGHVAVGLTGSADGASTAGVGGNSLEGELQTAFNAFGTPGQLKKFGMVRPIFLSQSAPSVQLQMNTQYTFSGIAGSPSYVNEAQALWGSSNWNQVVWFGTTNTYQSWVGAAGLGYYGSIRMKLRGAAGTLYTSAHVMNELGGVM